MFKEKKVRYVVFPFVLAAIILMITCFTGCAKKNKTVYKTEIQIVTSTESGGIFVETLSEDSPTFEHTIGVFPFTYLIYRAEFHVLENDGTPGWSTVYSTKIDAFESEIEGLKVTYTVQNGDDMHKAGFNPFDFNLTTHDVMDGEYDLESSAGIHHLHYSIPALEKYNTKAAEYDVILHVDNDKRQGVAKIVLDTDYKAMYSAEQTGNYDFYVLDKAPRFVAKAVDTEEYLTGDLSANYRILNENTGKPITGYEPYDEILNGITSKGLYLCRVEFYNDPNYQVNTYTCYILLIWFIKK